MLGWWRKLVGNASDARAVTQRAFVPGVRVEHDADRVNLMRTEMPMLSVRWSELGNVSIVTSSERPIDAELFWVLQTRDKRHSLTIPMGADGERDLVVAMQSRLKGFDNMAVIEAMGTMGQAGFVVWDCDWPQDERT